MNQGRTNQSVGKVLAVDDDSAAADELARLIGGAVPCDFSVTSDAREAILLVSKNDYDLVITDLKMPGRDGLALLAEIKAISSRCEVIVLTSFSSLSTAIDSMKLGAVEYISKNSNSGWLDDLIRATRQALLMRPSGRAPGFHRENLIHFFLQRIGGSNYPKESFYGHFPAGLALEYAVKLLLESCQGLETTWHRWRTPSEEHDIVCLNKVNEGFWARQGPIVMVECKDLTRSRPGANERGRFEEKIRNRQGQSTAGIFISTKGFAKTFKHPTSRTPVPGGAPPIVVMIDEIALKDWSQAYDRLLWLTQRAVESVF